jgi:Leucine-rich repeat (LRR) protein
MNVEPLEQLRAGDIDGLHIDCSGYRVDLTRLTHLRSLRSLELWFSPRLEKEGFLALREFPVLEKIWFHGGVKPEELVFFKDLESVTRLCFPESGLTGEGFSVLKEMPNLQFLDLYENPVTDAGLAEICEITSLRSLFMKRAEITDDGLAPIRNLESLERLSLWLSPITDRGLTHLESLTSLNTLNLCGTKVTDKGLALLTDLSALETLWLPSADTLTTEAIPFLAQMPSLREIILFSGKPSEEIHEQLREALPKCRLSCYE